MRFFYFLIIISLVFGACRKSERDKDTEVQSSKDFTQSMRIFLNIFRTADYYSKMTPGIYRLNQTQTGCDSVWFDTLSSPKKIIIDFGTGGCSAFDGTSKRGKMTITYTSKYHKTNNVSSITLNNFYVYDLVISGTVSITNTSDTAATAIPKYAFNVSNGKIKDGDKYLDFACATNITMSAGQTTTTTTDDAFKVTGTYSGRSSLNNTYAAKTISEVEYGYSCDYPQAGKIDLTPTNLGTRNLDFGSGCDSKFTIVLFYNTYEESIP